MHKEWSIMDSSLGACTIEENIELCGLSWHSKSIKYVSNPPLFPSIPLKNVIDIDNLHLFLRVSDVLIDQLILELRRQDTIDKTKRFTTFDVKPHRTRETEALCKR